jgi:hypothetical protein
VRGVSSGKRPEISRSADPKGSGGQWAWSGEQRLADCQGHLGVVGDAGRRAQGLERPAWREATEDGRHVQELRRGGERIAEGQPIEAAGRAAGGGWHLSLW